MGERTWIHDGLGSNLRSGFSEFPLRRQVWGGSASKIPDDHRNAVVLRPDEGRRLMRGIDAWLVEGVGCVGRRWSLRLPVCEVSHSEKQWGLSQVISN